MSRTNAQAPLVVWNLVSASGVSANASINAGSVYCEGYSRIVGAVFSDASLIGTCGVLIRQSSTSTPNWDVLSMFPLTASSGSGFSVEIVGRYVDVAINGGAVAATSSLRAYFWLKPV